ncbi:hypothetical protein GCM10008171_27470 [Methylopila jiangsuensis]|uniref:Uncharacterized protein n=1 Tax=Methylopila jiangsuensis TaxID=586230 RepID=A0A9W6JJT2_9HYPH|nr:hypothetical protein [Methylopila jiangsuensis]MDR6285120.1 hypothetical protein [Methylopila jiangsuensis]GLK77493.1 hypothetical protein GCM10008171_27470 [Methylopila jiangsuensis]
MTERSPEDVERRLRAKRTNERLKLAASTSNAVGLTILGAAVLVPVTTGKASWFAALWILAAVALHVFAQAVLGVLRSED